MSKVICTLPNASELINGVKFEPHERGVISEDISDEQAEAFLAIPGYELDGGERKPAPKAPANDGELEELRKRAAELGIDFKGTWKQDRLKAEIEKAEAKKAADEAEAAKKAAEEAAKGGAGDNPETNA